MNGKHRIVVQSKRVKFDLIVQRNITILRGDSATGKTTLIDMIDQYCRAGEASGVSLYCDKRCEVLEERRWESNLAVITDSIIFIDEGNKFVFSKEFAKAIRHTDNYYVIVSRENFSTLPYSINEIFGFKTSDRYANIKQVYNEAFNMYSGLTTRTVVKPTLIITEDSKAGGQFFNSLGVRCIHAGGKSNIIKYLSHIDSNDKVLVVADGSALGSEIDAIMQELYIHTNITLYAPESFEWLLLKANLFPDGNKIKAVLDNPAEYIDSKFYFSWERFFTAYLVDITTRFEDNGSMIGYKYPSNKDKLPEVYLTKKSKDKILAVIPLIVFSSSSDVSQTKFFI